LPLPVTPVRFPIAIGTAGAVTFVIATKVTKKASQQKCFFAAHGLNRTIGQNLGWSRTCGIFAPLRSLAAHASAKSSYALQPHMATIVFGRFWPKLFC
jgi:hypothetical protein